MSRAELIEFIRIGIVQGEFMLELDDKPKSDRGQ
jgi:hypothetical protein